MGLEPLHFLRPWWLLLMVGSVFLWWRSKKTFPASSNWEHVVDAHLRPFVLVGKSGQRSARFWLPLFVMLLSLALAGPTIQKIASESNLVKRPVVVVLELSSHMLSVDISPSRLKRALFKLADILAQHKEREVALIAFAGDAHVVTPLTLDHETIVSLSENLTPAIMPIDGANVLSGLREAVLLNQQQTDIVVITSSNIQEPADVVNKFVNEHNLHPIFWIFATEAGAPLFGADGRFSAQPGKNVEISQLRKDFLQELARHGTTQIVNATADDSDEKIIGNYLSSEVRATNQESQRFDQWQDLGPYILIAAVIIFLVASFFQGPSWLQLCLFVLVVSPKVKAWSFSDWFLRSDQRAYQALVENKPEEAARLYEDRFAKGSALYKAKKFEESAAILSEVHSSDGQYNLGNALAHLNKIPEAIKAYDEALKLDPKNVDALTNKKILENLLKDQEQQQKDQQQEQENKDQENKNPENKDQEKQDQKESEQKDNKSSKENTSDERNSGNQEKNDKESRDAEKPEKEQGQPEQKPTQEPQKSAESEPKKQGARPVEGEPVDAATKYYFDQIEQNNSYYLQRKFRQESRKLLKERR